MLEYYKDQLEQTGDDVTHINFQFIGKDGETNWMHLNKKAANQLTAWLLKIYPWLED